MTTKRNRKSTRVIAAKSMPSAAEIAEKLSKQRKAAIDNLSDLESAIIKINAVTEILIELGSATRGGEIFHYLGSQMHDHHAAARTAFNSLWDHFREGKAP